MKKIFLFLFLIPYFAFAQNFPQGEGGISDSLLPGKDELNEPATTPLPGVNDDELLIPKDVAPPTTQNPGQYPNTNTSFTPSKNDFSAGIDTSILNQPAPNYPAVPAPTNVAILDQIVSGSIFEGTPLNKVLNQLFYIGLVAAIILAIVMIIRGGIEYMTVDSITSKESGKKRVQAALGGLVLAFSAILILNTVNPGLTSLQLQFEQLQGISSIAIETDIYGAVNQFQGLTNDQIKEIMSSGKIPTNISPGAQKILAEALAAINNLKTGSIDNTQGGKLACAAAVNKIVELATGQAIGGGLSTAEMYKSLQSNSRFQLVPGGVSAAQPGDIIISPTIGKNTGHVGIVATTGAGTIISNSSTYKVVKDSHTASSWDNYYGSKKGLQTYIYRPL
jgi:hypothetical protein